MLSGTTWYYKVLQILPGIIVKSRTNWDKNQGLLEQEIMASWNLSDMNWQVLDFNWHVFYVNWQVFDVNWCIKKVVNSTKRDIKQYMMRNRTNLDRNWGLIEQEMMMMKKATFKTATILQSKITLMVDFIT